MSKGSRCSLCHGSGKLVKSGGAFFHKHCLPNKPINRNIGAGVSSVEMAPGCYRKAKIPGQP